jgi:predicted transcriptional regulator
MTIRLDDETRTALTEIAQEEGVTVSTLIRQQIDALFIASDTGEWL